MEVTEPEMVRDRSELQISNAPLPMEVTESGMMKDSSELQPANAKSPIQVTEPEMDRDSSELQPSNAFSPMEVLEPAMLRDRSELQRLNALLPIEVTESGMMKDTSELQSTNARSPMRVTEDGILMLVRRSLFAFGSSCHARHHFMHTVRFTLSLSSFRIASLSSAAVLAQIPIAVCRLPCHRVLILLKNHDRRIDRLTRSKR